MEGGQNRVVIRQGRGRIWPGGGARSAVGTTLIEFIDQLRFAPASGAYTRVRELMFPGGLQWPKLPPAGYSDSHRPHSTAASSHMELTLFGQPGFVCFFLLNCHRRQVEKLGITSLLSTLLHNNLQQLPNSWRVWELLD